MLYTQSQLFRSFECSLGPEKSCFVLYDLSDVSGTTNFHRHKCNLSLNNDFRCVLFNRYISNLTMTVKKKTSRVKTAVTINEHTCRSIHIVLFSLSGKTTTESADYVEILGINHVITNLAGNTLQITFHQHIKKDL